MKATPLISVLLMNAGHDKFNEVFSEAFRELDGFQFWKWFNIIAFKAFANISDIELEEHRKLIYHVKQTVKPGLPNNES